MCGITAIRTRVGQVSPSALARGTSALRHRGPDGDGRWLSPAGNVGLGHTRLAIVGSNGAQPIRNENGRVHAVVNGEFYEYQDIRYSLQSRGHRFCSESDSEILLHLYEE